MNIVGDIYVVDYDNNRIVCWPLGSQKGRFVHGENSQESESNQFSDLRGSKLMKIKNENRCEVSTTKQRFA